jgi:hypothetical protein
MGLPFEAEVRAIVAAHDGSSCFDALEVLRQLGETVRLLAATEELRYAPMCFALP